MSLPTGIASWELVANYLRMSRVLPRSDPEREQPLVAALRDFHARAALHGRPVRAEAGGLAFSPRQGADESSSTVRPAR